MGKLTITPDKIEGFNLIWKYARFLKRIRATTEGDNYFFGK